MLLKSVSFLDTSFWPYILIINDDKMTFFGNFVYLRLYGVICDPRFANVPQTEGRKINNFLSKSHVIPLFMYSSPSKPYYVHL